MATLELGKLGEALALCETIACMKAESEIPTGFSFEDTCSTVNDLIYSARKITGIKPGYPVYCVECGAELEDIDQIAEGLCAKCTDPTNGGRD